MTPQAATTTAVRTASPVTRSIVVQAPIERAFDVFTRDMSSWWPSDHHILEAELAEMVFEPRAGGHIIDRGVDGSECRWSRVLAYEPPARVVFSWDISLAWQLETDPARASEIEVRFTAEAPERTRVELEHRHLERHGQGWEKICQAVASPRGWDLGMQAFAQRLQC
jgi:uncharacterized protein YndB with AHSA1/START domain